MGRTGHWLRARYANAGEAEHAEDHAQGHG